tara:strand:+ start:1685 stop:1972 length:288 start_codon:yes stop_codon:yes gene_type:complete
MKVEIKTSDKKDKKYMAVFTDDNKKKTIHFGAKGMDDYTLTKDKQARDRYRARTKKVYDKSDPMSASRLAGDILWGDSTSVVTNIKNYKKKYGYI